jgi:hypothetical protein
MPLGQSWTQVSHWTHFSASTRNFCVSIFSPAILLFGLRCYQRFLVMYLFLLSASSPPLLKATRQYGEERFLFFVPLGKLYSAQEKHVRSSETIPALCLQGGSARTVPTSQRQLWSDMHAERLNFPVGQQ